LANPLAGISRTAQLSFEQIEQLVESEPAFCAKVIEHANSQEGTTPAVTVKQALRRLDTGQVAQLIGEVSANNFGERYPEIVRHFLRKIWTHLIFASYAARELARWTQKVDPDEAFVAAMFNNVAVPVVMCAVTRHTQGDPIVLSHDTGMIKFINNQQRGMSRRMLESWNFAERIATFPELCASPLSSDLAAIVTVATETAMAYGYSYGGLGPQPDRLRELLRYLGLEHSSVNTLIEVIGPRLNGALSIVRSI
jgi:HD-like signal output (HDOD) protein